MIYKTILRKCRRFIQDEFNGKTSYFSQRKQESSGFLRECVDKFLGNDSYFSDKHGDFLFYMGKFPLITFRLYPIPIGDAKDCGSLLRERESG